jgi:hypothetical protein
MNRTPSLFAAVCAFVLFPAAASAQDQPWLKDRRYTEGIGARVGDFELHPGVAAEFGYDSNYFLRGDKTIPQTGANEDPIGAMRLRITPSFSVSTLSPQRRLAAPGTAPPDVEFRGGVSATYNEYFPVSGSQAGRDLIRQQRNVAGAVDMALSILPSRPWSAILSADLVRDVTPTNAGATDVSFNRLMPRGGAELIYQPGGGLFDWRLGYQFSATMFESSAFSGLTNLDHRIETRGRWRFLPRTALMYDAKFDFISYPNTTADTSGLGGKSGSHPVRAQLGLNGLITPTLAITALAGWGASFYQPAGQQDFDSVIGTAELRWYLTPNPSAQPGAATMALSSLAVGFQRDFFDSYIGTYFERDRGYLNFSYFFGGRFLLIVDGGPAAIRYPVIPSLNATKPFTDIRIDASLFGEYRLTDSFGINATVRYGHNLSNTVINVAGAYDELQWQRFESYLGVRWFL